MAVRAPLEMKNRKRKRERERITKAAFFIYFYSTGATSALGELFDHIVDASSVTLFLLMTAMSIGLGPERTLIVQNTLQKKKKSRI